MNKKKVMELLSLDIQRSISLWSKSFLSFSDYNLIGLIDYDPVCTGDFLEEYITLVDDLVIDALYVNLTNISLIRKSTMLRIDIAEPEKFSELRKKHAEIYNEPIEWGLFLYGESWMIFYNVKYDEAILYHKELRIKEKLPDYIY